jgi:type I restriction enzyme M protein
VFHEYFLMKFAMQGAQDSGEFFTPPSLVQTIVNVNRARSPGSSATRPVARAACSVQSSHFIERLGQDTAHRVTFYGQEKTATTIRLAKMNLAVHGLEGDIREANTSTKTFTNFTASAISSWQIRRSTWTWWMPRR